jgi:nucleoside-diphosphate-sugar epimerase
MQALAITGSTGFLGRHLVTECLARGGFSLKLLARGKEGLPILPKDRVTICRGDLHLPESLSDFLEPGITLVNLAYARGNNDGNIRATENLIEAIRQSGVKRVVHCSTALVVGFKPKGVITENTLACPKGTYQVTKYRIEQMLRSELPPDTELAILRPTEVIGPGGLGLRWFINRLRYGSFYRNFIYHCILKHRRFNYVSVNNVVAALILLANTDSKQTNALYNISDDDDIDNNYDSVEKIISSNLALPFGYPVDIGLPPALLSLLLRLIPGHSPPDRVYSYDRISALGYEKAVSLRRTISEMVLQEITTAD